MSENPIDPISNDLEATHVIQCRDTPETSEVFGRTYSTAPAFKARNLRERGGTKRKYDISSYKTNNRGRK
jgi:hypothetical protein